MGGAESSSPVLVAWSGETSPSHLCKRPTSLRNSKSFKELCPKVGTKTRHFCYLSQESREVMEHVLGMWGVTGSIRDVRTVLSLFAKRSYLAAEIGCFCQNERFLRFLLRCQHEPSSPGARPCVWGDGADLGETVGFREPESAEIWINVSNVHRRPLGVSPL